ncbi:transcriptional regulator [Enterobacteriaceae bacterium H16N7]|nr:transcriptional regulator [Dryocola clanedunensis]
MKIIINSWKLESSLNALVHVETGEVQRLGEFHYILLETLVQHAGDVLSRNFLINEVWKNRVVGNNSLPTAIYALRIALGDDGKQQEIIKTIPKKGYIFSKQAIVSLEEESASSAHEQDIQTEASVNEDALLAETVLSFNEQALTASEASQNETPPPVVKNIRSRRLKISAAIIILVVIIFTGYRLMPLTNNEAASHNNATPPIPLTVRDLTKQDNEQLKIFHLQHSGTERTNPSLMTHAPEILTPLKQVLTSRHASAMLYYYSSIHKISVDILVKNQCQKEYQLIMNIQNWSQDKTRLGQLMGQEVERTLNEMPDCK